MSATSPVPEEERLARAALSLAGEPGHPRITDEVSAKGGRRTYDDLLAGRSVLSEDLAARMQRLDPAAELARAAARGVRFVVPGDEEWPGALDDLAFAPAVQERGGVPVGLWVRGAGRLEELAREAVAVVGSRSASAYGGQLAADIAATVAASGYTVVSGAAFGIDFQAHRGALTVDGPTVAVLACGVDRAYPAKHAPLLEHVAQRGVVVSEAPLGGAAMRVRFLARNRLIAGLCRGTVVVEAAYRSGALNTANWTDGLGRTLMGVPGPVSSATSAGVHQLIRSRGALLVTSGAEVLEAIGPIGSFLLRPMRGAERARDLLDSLEQQVLDAVPVVRAAPTQSVARTAGVEPQRTRQALGRLADAGLVECVDGGWRVRPGQEETEPG
ncbi:MAG TPA: DNA-processing protein DprA [Marmoricola sp.]